MHFCAALVWYARAWLAQVPLLQTSVFGYAVFCGAQFSLNLGQPGARLAIGVNLLALCIAFWLMRKGESADPALSPAPAKPA
ncbi:MAG: hypothetical protein ACRYF7_01830 [Janthinobacterium lividum]